MRNPLFESICFAASMVMAPIMAFRLPRSDERFGIMMAFATVSVVVAVVILAIAFFEFNEATERPPA